MRVYTLVLFGGSAGDDVYVFTDEAKAQAAALDYMRETWPGDTAAEVEDCPDDFESANELYTHGSFDNRFDLSETELQPVECFGIVLTGAPGVGPVEPIVGPFDTQEAAEAWLAEQMDAAGATDDVQP